MEPIYWLIAAGVFLALEILTLGLTSVWFAGGAFIAFFAALCHAPLWIQIVVFLAVSILLLLFTRPVVEKHLNNSRAKTNVDSLVGRQGKVTEEINNFNQTGKVILDGMEWTARSAGTEELIPAGVRVEVQKVRGAHLEVTICE
ncbi:MAG: NfeD family protein [Clostridiaceae bacterium]|nr:NfeD family protein [Clostridiaceae bacterium]